ncbi:HAE1 family hydrophobic/amphiphilic exporter-1 [Sphingomonas vulcanisoli]|uniref:Efflux pump membrane transporter n=1 Tax=Sphingomonas vulcanisoli TaxID=1658060 RepID=A0ABX0TPB1_9SPHN|nr:multidrug efflux RND transporter permease subunit [Sphingomonas vulcanisoli]NIJ07373.1 HAE1 family hydrophobic/amphiphilic exporter-1 [Sphingomonas vulcanisoli]
MKISHFFIERPIFAAVISIVIVLLGAIAYPLLPVAQYPEIVPPTVVVSAQFPGASAEDGANLVAEPIEEQINGVEDMLYMSSQSTGDGRVAITITFKLGTDLDKAQVLVQNRVSVALPRLPAQVQLTGVVVRKSSPDLLLAVHLTSPDHSLDRDYIGNYFTLNIRDQLLRIPGVGDLTIRGPRDFSIRVWIDPNKAAERGLDAEDITQALSRSNVQVAAGTVNQDPSEGGGGAYQLNIETKGRLTSPEEFANVVIKRDSDGRVTRVSDIGRVELGAQDYTTEAHLNEDDAILIAVQQLPGSNAVQTADLIQQKVAELSKTFPPGLKANIVYNPTQYVEESLKEVRKTLLEALILVVIVVIVFLQSWRAAIVPVLAIPISLVGTFAMMLAAGFSLNNLSMFGLVLAIGIVVDDAIVVIENVERRIREGDDPRTAAHRSMDEVGGALVGIALVLCAVFVPAGLISGITGQFYRQFALTIATATLISLLVSLTLSPALAALVMKPHEEVHEEDLPAWRRPLHRGAEKFNQGFTWLSDHYGRLTGRLVKLLLIMLLIYGGLLLLTGWRIAATPTGFIPDQDQGSLIVAAKLPEGTSLRRTDEISKQLVKVIDATPGVLATSATTGVDATSNTAASNSMQIYVVLDAYGARAKHHQTIAAMIAAIEKATAPYVDADIKVIPPPSVRGIGTAGGFKLIVEDRGKAGMKALDQATQTVIAATGAGGGDGKSQADNVLTRVFTSFNTRTPRLHADIDREKAEIMGVQDSQIFAAMQTYLASSYINDFNYLGRTYQVRAQADWPYRATDADISQLKIRTASGAMAPLGSFVTVTQGTGPYRVARYNMYPAAEVQGSAAQGRSSGEALAAMEKVAQQSLPPGFNTEWTELAYQQEMAGNTGYIVFAMAVVFAFLVLAALYESATLPLAVLLIVPMCLLAAMLGVNLMALDNNILTQVGLIVLVGLAAKNAILIIEFAKQDEDDGQEVREAAVNAAKTRLRPILMTSFAFILGVAPLAFASGAGAEMRRALGTAVFFGMIGVTVFGLIFTPVFYVAMRKLSSKLPQPKQAPGAEPQPQ